MNFLAHAYLSFNHAEVMVGNMISDFVKGKARYDFIPAIQNGIELHRRIDTFTDAHAVTKKAQEIFRPSYRLYSGPFVDIVFDHFLATDPTLFSEESLFQFTQQVYDTLDRFTAHLPPRFLAILPYMKTYNWLYHYRETDGIQRSFNGLVRRSQFLTEADGAFELFLEQYAFLQECYELFFGELEIYTQQQFKLLVT